MVSERRLYRADYSERGSVKWWLHREGVGAWQQGRKVQVSASSRAGVPCARLHPDLRQTAASSPAAWLLQVHAWRAAGGQRCGLPRPAANSQVSRGGGEQPCRRGTGAPCASTALLFGLPSCTPFQAFTLFFQQAGPLCACASCGSHSRVLLCFFFFKKLSPRSCLLCRDATILVFCAPHQFIHRIVKQARCATQGQRQQLP